MSVDRQFRNRAPSGAVAVGYRSTVANQSVNSGAFAAMNIQGTADHDTGGLTRSGDIVTVLDAGIYYLHANVIWNSPGANCRVLARIETWTGSDPGVGSGTQIAFAEQTGIPGVFVGLNCVTHRMLAAGAKVRALLWQNSGAALVTQGGVTDQKHQLNIAQVS